MNMQAKESGHHDLSAFAKIFDPDDLEPHEQNEMVRHRATIAPKLLCGREICDLAELLTSLAIHTLLYSRK